jgi:hypothetical protein
MQSLGQLQRPCSLVLLLLCDCWWCWQLVAQQDDVKYISIASRTAGKVYCQLPLHVQLFSLPLSHVKKLLLVLLLLSLLLLPPSDMNDNTYSTCTIHETITVGNL